MNALLQTVAKEDGAQKAEDLLIKMEKQIYRGRGSVGSCPPRPDAVSYTVVAAAWGKRRTLEGAGRAEALLDRLSERYGHLGEEERRRGKLWPDAILYNTVISAYSRTGTYEGAEQAERLLRQMEKLEREGNPAVKPDSFGYNSVVNGWAFCKEKKGERVGGSGSNSDGEGVSGVLPSLRALRMLEHLLDLRKSGLTDARLDSATFSTTLQSFVRSSAADSAELAEYMLLRKDEYRSEDPKVFAHQSDYLSVLHKWGNSRMQGVPKKEGAKRSFALLERMIQRHDEDPSLPAPDDKCHNTVMDTIAKSGDPDAAERALSVLYLMKRRFEEGKSDVAPDRISYHACLEALLRSEDSSAPVNMRDLLNEMISRFETSGDEGMRPDAADINMLLKKCALSPRAAATRGTNVGDEQGTGCDPFGIAIESFETLLGNNGFGRSPSHRTYGYMLLACSNHMDNENPRKAALAQRLFRRCRDEGQVSPFVVELFSKAVPGHVCRRELGIPAKEPMSIWEKLEDIPQDWRRNVTPLHGRGKPNSQQGMFG